ncbi:hypothetical protein B0H11DRAFT_1900753 [Mycena galericulata]|nr:hypothetical protein B0H11DRAFT_1906417 [Mycena galericulata]KAJ7510444.1 hypothetical protein B0H11DRAFT_1900753 [Mycena galericulata]
MYWHIPLNYVILYNTHRAPLLYPPLCVLLLAGSDMSAKKRHPAAYAALSMEFAATVISQTTHPTASAWLSPDALCGAKHCIRGQGFRFKLLVFVLILPRISARIATMDGAACCQRGAQANLQAGHSLITECTAETLHLNRSHARGRVPQEPSCLAAHAALGARIRGYAACAAECGRIADRPRGARHGAWLWVTRDTERRMRQRGAHGSRSSPCTHCQQADAGTR